MPLEYKHISPKTVNDEEANDSSLITIALWRSVLNSIECAPVHFKSECTDIVILEK